jgi:hypothetical protein
MNRRDRRRQERAARKTPQQPQQPYRPGPAPTLRALGGRRQLVVPVEVDGQTEAVTLTVAPAALRSPATYARMAQIQAAGPEDGMPLIPSLVGDLIVGWDLVGDDGAPVPVTVETLAALGADVLMQLFIGITNQLTGKTVAMPTWGTGQGAEG